MKGKFIVIDGSDGCGKTTQTQLLVNYLRQRGKKVSHLREPGGSPIGEKIRRILLDPGNRKMSIQTELFLYMASRAQLVQEFIKPALVQGKIVVCDRFLSASVAYQGWAGGLGGPAVESMGKIATDNIKPDLIIILDIRPVDGLRRRSKKGRLDRIETRQLVFHNKVRQGFRALAKQNPKLFCLISAYGSTNVIQSRIQQEVSRVI